MSTTQKDYDPRYSPTPPFKRGDVAYLKDGEIFHVMAVAWSLEHKQWCLDMIDPETGQNLPKRSAFGLLTKRQFFTRQVTHS